MHAGVCVSVGVCVCVDVCGRASRLCCVSRRRRAWRSHGMMWPKPVRRHLNAESAPAAAAGCCACHRRAGVRQTFPCGGTVLRGLCRFETRSRCAGSGRRSNWRVRCMATRSLMLATENSLSAASRRMRQDRQRETGEPHADGLVCAGKLVCDRQRACQSACDHRRWAGCRGDVDRLGGGADQVCRHPAPALPRGVLHLACLRAVCCASTPARCMSAL